MSDIIVNGKNQAIRQPDSYKFDPIRGWQTVIRYRGTKAKIFALVPQFTNTGCTIDVFSNNGAVWELQASSPTAMDGSVEVPVNVWESTANIVGKDILDAPACANISATDLVKIKAAIQNPAADGSEPTPALTGDALIAYRLIKRGAGYEINQPILRHTQIVSAGYATVTAYSNVGRIFSSASVGAPGDFLTGLPASGVGTSNIPGGSSFGWKKKPPQVQTSAYNKRQVLQEFEYGEWSTFLYGALV